MDYSHQPVMVDEVIEYLITDTKGLYVDGTVGTAGHSIEICRKLAPFGRLICLDVDSEAVRITNERLSQFKDLVTIVKGSYVGLKDILGKLGIGKVHGILLDLGMSSHQLESSGRGFSFLRDEPLDMRMDEDITLHAEELVNTLTGEKLEEVIWNYGQERWAKVISRAILKERQKYPIRSSKQLSRLIEAAIPDKYHPRRIHPATRTFQALRIAVNRELGNIRDFLKTAPQLLEKKGRIVVISYHSLEDRIIKHTFRHWSSSNIYPRKLPVSNIGKYSSMRIVTKKGIRPSENEVYLNPRSRSAILRVAERC